MWIVEGKHEKLLELHFNAGVEHKTLQGKLINFTNDYVVTRIHGESNDSNRPLKCDINFDDERNKLHRVVHFAWNLIFLFRFCTASLSWSNAPRHHMKLNMSVWIMHQQVTSFQSTQTGKHDFKKNNSSLNKFRLKLFPFENCSILWLESEN